MLVTFPPPELRRFVSEQQKFINILVLEPPLNLRELIKESQSMHCGCTHVCLCVHVSTEALRLQSGALWSKHGRRSAQLEELMRSLEQWSDVSVGQHDAAKLLGAYMNTSTSEVSTVIHLAIKNTGVTKKK